MRSGQHKIASRCALGNVFGRLVSQRMVIKLVENYSERLRCYIEKWEMLLRFRCEPNDLLCFHEEKERMRNIFRIFFTRSVCVCVCAHMSAFVFVAIKTNKIQNILFTYVWQKNKSFNMIRQPNSNQNPCWEKMRNQRHVFRLNIFGFRVQIALLRKRERARDGEREITCDHIYMKWLHETVRDMAYVELWIVAISASNVCERERSSARIEARIVTKSKTNVYFSNIHFVTVDSWYRAKYVNVCWADGQCLHCTHIRRWLKLLVKKAFTAKINTFYRIESNQKIHNYWNCQFTNLRRMVTIFCFLFTRSHY